MAVHDADRNPHRYLAAERFPCGGAAGPLQGKCSGEAPCPRCVQAMHREVEGRPFGYGHQRAKDEFTARRGREQGEPVVLAEYELFFRIHQSWVLGWTHRKARRIDRYFGSVVDVEGAVQEAFLALWRHLFHCDARNTASRLREPGVWVARVAWLQVLRQVDRGGVQQQTLITELSQRGQAEHLRLSDSVVTSVLAAEAMEQILALPGNQGLVGYLRFVLEWSNDEIAEVLGMSNSTVRQHVHRTRAKLDRTYTRPSTVIIHGEPAVIRGRSYAWAGAACVIVFVSLAFWVSAWLGGAALGVMVLAGCACGAYRFVKRRSSRANATKARAGKENRR